MLWEYNKEYLRLLDEHRASRLAALESVEHFDALRLRVRTQLERMWGPFPARASLSSRRLGRIEHAELWIERIVFESRPSLHVTADPCRSKDGDGRVPVVIFPCRHAAAGKCVESY